MPNVAFVREELKKLLPQYDTIRDCLGGETVVKYRKAKYLPRPNAADTSANNLARYEAYLTRAVFYNVAERTLLGLTGQIFLRDPNVDVPDGLQMLIDDATGEGVPMQQLANELTEYTLPYGRAGIYVDYPDTGDQPTSVADVKSGKIRPTIKAVAPWDAINWRVKNVGAQIVLSLVVFREDYTVEDDGFETKVKSRWRVLRLDEANNYYIEIYTEKDTEPQRIDPRDAAGNPLKEIPFKFIGSKSNTAKPSLPPMYSICNVNIAHYRNSADYEEAVYMLGQPTPWFAGLTEDWVSKVMGGGVMLGSRSAVMLPENGSAGLLQAEPNILAKEAMDQKEAQMLALGAKLVEGGQVERTATEADIDNVSETSVLSSVAKNVGAAIKWALEQAALFVGVTGEITYDMNTEFDLVNLSPEERKALLAEWQGNAITFEEYRASLRRAGIAYLSDDDAKAQLEEQASEAMARATEEAGAIAEATNLPSPDKPAPVA